MTLFPHLYELDFWGVYDRGKPNEERIIFRPLEPIELGRYAIAPAIKQPGGLVRLFFDNVFWPPDVVVEPPAWIFLYTAAGKPKVTVESITQAPVHALYGRRKTTNFQSPDI